MELADLRDKHKELRGKIPDDLSLRAHRAISWISRAGEICDVDLDAAFIFAWIAFNAAYAKDGSEDNLSSGRTYFREFFISLVEHDCDRRIAGEIWGRYQSVTGLLDNQYIFAPFWKFHNGDGEYENWESSFEGAKRKAHAAIKRRDMVVTLEIVFDRLYVLRNQILHGGSTWNSRVNRKQLKDATALLRSLVAIFIDLIVSNPDHNWGLPYYRVVESN